MESECYIGSILICKLAVLILLSSLVSSETKDSTGLVGTSPALLLGSTQLPLQFWANPRKSALKPRKRDLHEPTLMALLGSDYDSRWMKKSKPQLPTEIEDEEDRKAVRALRVLLNSNNNSVGLNIQLPNELPMEYREIVKTWLVRQATCPIRFVWDNLGPYFWPRWIRRGECVRSDSTSCSWPPGMTCVPAGARNLHVLRWHCRLRKHQGKGKRRKKSKNENQVWTGNGSGSDGTSINSSEASGTIAKARRKKRRKYRCFWIKVPYPVPEDCICACTDKDNSESEPDDSVFDNR